MATGQSMPTQRRAFVSDLDDDDEPGEHGRPLVMDDQEQADLIRKLRAHSVAQDRKYRQIIVGFLILSLVVHLVRPIPGSYLGPIVPRVLLIISHDLAIVHLYALHLLSLRPPPPPPSLPAPPKPYAPMGMALSDLEKMAKPGTMVGSLVVAGSLVGVAGMRMPLVEVGLAALGEWVMRNDAKAVDRLEGLKYEFKGA